MSSRRSGIGWSLGDSALDFLGSLVFTDAQRLMDGTEQAVQTGFFGLALWLKCGLAGTVVGAAVAAAQVFPGRWHPAWAQRLLYWFSCPLFAGLATGVVIALRGVPPLASARTFWLILCLVIGGVASTAAAAAVAFLSKNYDPDVVSKSKRVSRRSPRRVVSPIDQWEDHLRRLFRPPPTAESSARTRQESGKLSPIPETSSTPSRKVKLPPERYPLSEVSVRVPRYAGKPLRTPRPDQGDQGKLVKPIK